MFCFKQFSCHTIPGLINFGKNRQFGMLEIEYSKLSMANIICVGIDDDARSPTGGQKEWRHGVGKIL